MKTRLEEKLYKEYVTFFEKAERERRWNVFKDIPWERINEALRAIYDFVARDEIAHTRFYQGVIKVLLDEDREGTLADMALVFANFEMPGVGLVPDYDTRILKIHEARIHRAVFIQKVYIPILKFLAVSRHELLAAQAKAIGDKRDRELEKSISSASVDA